MANDDVVSLFSSENRANIAVYPLDVFVLTDKGTAQIHGGATTLHAMVDKNHDYRGEY